MGDCSTHVVLRHAYWKLAYEENGYWINSDDHAKICKLSEAETVIKLEIK